MNSQQHADRANVLLTYFLSKEMYGRRKQHRRIELLLEALVNAELAKLPDPPPPPPATLPYIPPAPIVENPSDLQSDKYNVVCVHYNNRGDIQSVQVIGTVDENNHVQAI